MTGAKSCMIRLTLIAGTISLAVGLRARSSQVSKTENLESYTFQQFVTDFQRDYKEDTDEWTMRKDLFNRRISEMVKFNAQQGRTWSMGLSKFMDYTEAEKKNLLGYTGLGSRSNRVISSAATSLKASRELPSSFSVTAALAEKKRTSVLLPLVRDQGNCGSCWAMAATSVLEGQMEVNETLMAQLSELHTAGKVPETPTMASQIIVSCTPNPRNCGGKGGCQGATVELGYGMAVSRGGVPFAVESNYEGRDMACKENLFAGHRISITGHTVLPSNTQQPLLEAIVRTGGPIAVSVDATNWFSYGGGIYSDGKGEFTVNHAVTFMGYKMPEGGAVGWYDIKNSWGQYWGENGHIRVEMKADDEKHCGWDYNTHDGLACDGDPDTAWVCGTCGILYDSTFPTGISFQHAK